MQIETQEVRDFVERENKMFKVWDEKLGENSHSFNRGILAGLELVKNYIECREKYGN